ncbi:MAG: YdcF family protein [Magnetococcales bacterium]|nr:YdcF family protein [Magnetococcales bacterium]
MTRRPLQWIYRISLIINMVIFVILFTPITELLVQPLIIDEPVQPSPVAVIFASGWVAPDVMEYRSLIRLQKGLELYRLGLVKKIVCLGGTHMRNQTGNPRTVAQAMKSLMLLYGVQESDLFVHDKGSNTFEDIQSLLNAPQNRFDWNQAIYVTAEYHTFRVRKFLDYFNIRGRVVSAIPVETWPGIWSQRLDYFRETIREYLAILSITGSNAA